MSLRRFYLPPEMAALPTPRITGSDAGHIFRVLRLSAGDTVELVDGAGTGYRARILSAAPAEIRLAIEAAFPLMAESPVHITLALGMLKDRKTDDLIPPLTELGINRLILFYAARSIPVPKDRTSLSRVSRWEKIALEAVKQCRRGYIPQIVLMKDLDAALAASSDADLKLVFWEAAVPSGPSAVQDVPRPGKVLIVVGPEGGFEPAEIQKAQNKGCVVTSLGPRILRAQTAALAACVQVQFRFGDLR